MSAKDIQVKYTGTGGSGAFNTIPGPSGELNVEANRIDDTVLGANWTSEYPGLLSWTLSSTCYWKGHAGYEGQIKKDGAELCAQSVELSMSADTIDVSCLSEVQANGGWLQQDPGLRTVEVTLSGFYKNLGMLYDLTKRDTYTLTIKPVNDESDVATGDFKLYTDAMSGDVGPPENEELTFGNYTAIEGDSSGYETFAWTTSAMPTAIDDLIQAYMNEENVDVKYMPEGAEDDSSGAGAASGSGFVTDLTLSLATDGNVEFSVEIAGDGKLS